ncbi:MAG TPA: AMIN domain-containing protein [Gemmatimonadales bacterium]|nr:AMIN domain-containing protein [Gemmatimonadales bacterium]
MKVLIRSLLALALAVSLTPTARATAPQGGEVTAVTLQPAAGRAEVVIGIRGSVDVKDFVLQNPARLVLDVSGASLSAPEAAYDGVNRAGVRNIRYSQYAPNVVRIVLDLDALKDYTVQRDGDAIRVVFDAPRTFLSWSSLTPAALATPEPMVDSPVRVVPVSSEVTLQSPQAEAKPVFDDEPRITVSWDRASIADVVAGFAAFSGRNIVLGKDIKGEVSAEIRNQPWPEAFAAVLATQGLTAQEMPGGIIRVDQPATLAALDSLEPLETRLVQLDYKQADSLVKVVESVLTKRGKVVAATSANALVITDTKSRISSVADFVRGMDTRTAQVSIQAKIIVVDRRSLEQLGLKYDLGSRNQFFNKLVQRQDPTNPGETFDKDVNVIDLGGNSVSAIANADANITGSALDLVFSTAIGGFSLTSFLTALERVEMSDVQAEPLITTLDNQQADILVGDEIPLRIVDANSAAGSGAARSTVQFKETGIRLTVTPHVTSNRQILMNLATERSQVVPLAAADLGFSIQKQATKNQLLVNDGETSVIGGLTVTTVQKTRSGIPLLSGLPLVGNLFSFTSNDENRRDLIILVTPRIVDDGVTTP